MSILGNRVLRREDPKFLTVGGTYVGDLKWPGATYLSFVRSTVAHARIESVGLEEARAAPGVVAVYTNEDLEVAPSSPGMAFLNQEMKRTLLASGVVRYVGEPVVAIVSETREEGADAAELVTIDYEPLGVLVDPEEARREETLLFPGVGTNVAFNLDLEADDTIFDNCDVVVRQRIVNQRVARAPSRGARRLPGSRPTAGSSTSPRRRRRTVSGRRSPRPWSSQTSRSTSSPRTLEVVSARKAGPIPRRCSWGGRP